MIAITAASLFAAACSKKEEPKPASTETKPAVDKDKPTGEKTAKLHCQGVNGCKGKGGCKSTANACAGQNGCKGKGFVDVASEEDCKTKGGTVMAGM